MIGDSRLHRRGHAKCLVDPGEIIVHEVQGGRRLQVLDLLREGVGQPRKSPHAHAHREVLALDKRCGDVARIGVPLTNLGAGV